MRKKRLVDKKIKKHTDGECYFCGENDYDLLDVHRIIPGEEGGKYTEYNTLTACANCHRKIHSGKIQILGKYPTYTGKDVLHYITEDGEEKWE